MSISHKHSMKSRNAVLNGNPLNAKGFIPCKPLNNSSHLKSKRAVM